MTGALGTFSAGGSVSKELVEWNSGVDAMSCNANLYALVGLGCLVISETIICCCLSVMRPPVNKYDKSRTISAGTFILFGSEAMIPLWLEQLPNAPKPPLHSFRPYLISEYKPFNRPIMLDEDINCDSGAFKPVPDNSDGLYSGRKKEKTLPCSYAIWPILTSMKSSSTKGTDDLKSVARIKDKTFKIGSRNVPCAGSLSRTTERASRSSKTAAINASISPYCPCPNAIPWVVYFPVLKAVATAKVYRGVGFDIPKRCMKRYATKGGVFG